MFPVLLSASFYEHLWRLEYREYRDRVIVLHSPDLSNEKRADKQ